MEIKAININKLARPCITRDKAKDAISNLRKYVNDKQVVIDTNSVELISLSFLDELVFWIVRSGLMRRVIFRVDDPIIYDKLAHIVAFRQVVILCQSKDNEVHEVIPKASTSYNPKFIPNKSLKR